MPRLQTIDIDPVDVDTDGIAASQTPAAGGVQNLTLGGALTSGGVYTSADGGARQLVITAAANESARTFTVTGTDADGKAQTEAIAGPNATTVESTKYFLTVTQISTDDDTAGAITVGTVDELASKTIKLNRHATTGALLQLMTANGANINVTAQVALADPDDYTDQEAIPWISTQDTDLVAATQAANAIGSLDVHAVAFRLIVNSYSTGAEVQAYISQGYQ